MTYVSKRMKNVPAHMLYEPPAEHAGDVHEITLPIKGQGTIGFTIAELAPFSVTIRGEGWGTPVLRWDIDRNGARLSYGMMGEWTELDIERNLQSATDGLDPEQACLYWFSVDCQNRTLLYGKGEMRLNCFLARRDFPGKPHEGEDLYAWFKEIRKVEVDAAIAGAADVWRDPVAVDPPMKVVAHDAITMDDIAVGEVTVSANLSQRCQQLYDAVAGASFELDTKEFPDFSKAIRASIDNPAGWCAKTLKSKASEFGKSDPSATYLRITLGRNQGESPGIPYVMEIWPSGHYSPIHDHGGADAVIKVLHGSINVRLYRMLSPHHREPFARADFGPGEVTWISARLNQVHKLENIVTDGDPCITIQCYMYDETDVTHWPYFDYLEDGPNIGLFDPNSDATFAEFKAIMMDEWKNPPQPEPAPEPGPHG